MLPIGGDDRTRTYNLSFNRALLYAVELHPHIFQTSPLCRLSYPPLVIGARFELAPAKLFAVHKGVEPSPPGRQPGILHSLDQWTISAEVTGLEPAHRSDYRLLVVFRTTALRNQAYTSIIFFFSYLKKFQFVSGSLDKVILNFLSYCPYYYHLCGQVVKPILFHSILLYHIQHTYRQATPL